MEEVCQNVYRLNAYRTMERGHECLTVLKTGSLREKSPNVDNAICRGIFILKKECVTNLS